MPRLRRFIARAADAQRGGVAIMFSLSLLPLAFVTLGAVDCSRAIMTKAALQNALDAAALAVARNNIVDQAKMDELGLKVLKANLDPQLHAALATPSFQRVDTKIVASVGLSMSDTLIMPAMQIGAATDAQAAGDRLEVALVLDNTYSMVLDSSTATVVTDASATKLHKLKVASKSFIDRLMTASEGAEAGAVKVSLVPFSNTVNVGTGYQGAGWINSTGSIGANDIWGSSAPNRFTLLTQMNESWGGCVEARGGGHDVLETEPTGAARYTPYFAPDESGGGTGTRMTKNDYRADPSSGTFKEKQRALAKYTGTLSSTVKSNFNTGSRSAGDQPYYGLTLGYQYGPNLGCRLTPLSKLTTDLTGLKTKIDGMTAVGETMIPMGLAWGWNTLSPVFPWGENTGTEFKGVAYDYIHQPGAIKTRKIVVLMTDGDNTMFPIADGTTADRSQNPNRSLYSGYQYGWTGLIGTTSNAQSDRETALDSKMTTLCTNMKAKGIYIYTIRVEVAGGVNTALRDCATSPDMYYDVSNASQLNGVFNTIAGRITRLRLAS